MAGTTRTVKRQWGLGTEAWPEPMAAMVEELNRLVDDLELIRAAQADDRLISAPGLAIGTVDAAEVAFDDLQWQLGGVRYFLAAGEVAFTATTHDIADPDSDPREAIYVLSVAPGATAPTITKGSTAAEDEAEAPATPAGHVKLGEVLIQHDGGAIFDATSDDLDAAHLTVTFTDAANVAVPVAGDLTAGKILTSESGD